MALSSARPSEVAHGRAGGLFDSSCQGEGLLSPATSLFYTEGARMRRFLFGICLNKNGVAY